MRVGVLCEFSGVVRDAFRRAGHDAISCDLMPAEAPGPHIQGDCLTQDWTGYDLVIAHPPCTHLASSGARWFAAKRESGVQQEAIEFCRRIMGLPVPRIAMENPVGVLSTALRKPDQIIQPWQFGHGETKATCLWLKGLSPLTPTSIVAGREARIHREPPGPDRWKRRSVTFAGIAEAMAEQWGQTR